MGTKPTGKSLLRPSESSKGILLDEQLHAKKRGEKGDRMPQMLIESSPVLMTALEESKDGKYVARGEFGRVGIPTQNGRIYRKELMGREIERLSEDISSRRVLGELDHPESGKTSLKRVSHVITNLSVRDDGIIIGEAEILGTPEGKTLRALIDAKVQIGVSSRGFGSTRPSDDPKVEGDVVQDDFILKTWDFVADPAVKTAMPDIFIEDVNEQDDNAAEMFLSEFPEIAKKIQEDASKKAEEKVDADAKESIRQEMAEGFEKRLADTIAGMREELTESIRGELDTDPEVGGAKGILAAIAEMVSTYNAVPGEDVVRDSLRAAELDVAEAKEDARVATNEALEASCAAVVEQSISGHPMADSLRKLIEGAVFESAEEAKEKIDAIVADAPVVIEGYVSEEEAELRENNAKMQSQISLLSERVELLNSKLLKAVEVGTEASDQLQEAQSSLEEVEVKLGVAKKERKKALHEAELADERSELAAYKVQKVGGLPNGRKLLSILEDATSTDAIDKLVEERGVQQVPDEHMAAMRARLSRGHIATDGELNESQSGRKAGPKQPKLDEFGNDFLEMQRLAGVE